MPNKECNNQKINDYHIGLLFGTKFNSMTMAENPSGFKR